MQKLTMLVFMACAASAAAQAAETDTEAEYRDFIEIFVGITHDEGENDPSLGLTYEHRFGQFGTGVIAEFTKSDSRDSVLALPFFWHPADPWRMVVAIGTEYDDGENSFLTRVGGSYEFEFSGWSLSPEVNVDFVDDDTVLVIGASFVWKF
jgi:hypothetical protein